MAIDIERKKQRMKKYLKQWQKENKDKVAANNKKYRSKSEVKEKRKIYQKDYMESHKEERKEYRKLHSKETYQKRKEKAKAYQQTEEARMTAARTKYKTLGTESSLSVQEWKYALNYFNNECVYCGNKTNLLHKEHFIPVTKGGVFTKYNIVPSCARCNYKKRDNDPLQWLSIQPKGLVIYTKIIQYFQAL